MRFRGDYNPQFVYMTNDVVYRDGSSYIASKVVSINSPPPGDGWLLMAAGGRDGKPGIHGSRGDSGATGPGVPVGGSSGQVLVKETGADFDTAWKTPNHAWFGAAPAEHSHPIDQVEGLEAALGRKANGWHEHDVTQIAGLGPAMQRKADLVHSHIAGDLIAGDLQMKSITVTDAEFPGILLTNQNGNASLIREPKGLAIRDDATIRLQVGIHPEVTILKDKVMVSSILMCKRLHVETVINLGNAVEHPQSNDAGQPGDMRWDANYIYICTARNTWRRAALETW